MNDSRVAPSGISSNSLWRSVFDGRSATLSTRRIGNAAMTQARISSAWTAMFFRRGPRRPPSARTAVRAACATAGAGTEVGPLIRTLL